MGVAAVTSGQLMPSSIFLADIRCVVIILGSLSGVPRFLADRLITPRLKGVTAARPLRHMHTTIYRLFGHKTDGTIGVGHDV